MRNTVHFRGAGDALPLPQGDGAFDMTSQLLVAGLVPLHILHHAICGYPATACRRRGGLTWRWRVNAVVERIHVGAP